MTNTYHFVASAHSGLTPLKHPPLCARLWTALRIKFPHSVWACVFMPNHLHIIIETADPLATRRRLAIEIRAASRTVFPGKKIWAPLPRPSHVPDPRHLKRTIRYVHLNPCRSSLVRDPILWEWSTHRDVLGVTTSSWIQLDRMAKLCRCPASSLADTFHAYVSGAPSVAVLGTEPIRKTPKDAPFSADIAMCIRAIACVSRALESDVLKRGELRDAAIQLAVLTASHPHEKVGRVFKMNPTTVGRVLARATVGDQNAVKAGRVWLGDRRCWERG